MLFIIALLFNICYHKIRLSFVKSGEFEGGDTYEGSIEIPNLSEENDPEDIDVNVSVTKNDKISYNLKEFVRKTGTKLIQDLISVYIKDLRIGLLYY